jgi:hypothetical protein
VAIFLIQKFIKAKTIKPQKMARFGENEIETRQQTLPPI